MISAVFRVVNTVCRSTHTSPAFSGLAYKWVTQCSLADVKVVREGGAGSTGVCILVQECHNFCSESAIIFSIMVFKGQKIKDIFEVPRKSFRWLVTQVVSCSQ